jgi:hypothetical protein
VTGTPGPNVLLITTGQQRFEAPGAVDDEVGTPTLDRLVEAGALIDRIHHSQNRAERLEEASPLRHLTRRRPSLAS